MIPEASEKPQKWRRNPFKINDFVRCIMEASFVTFCLVFNTKMTILMLLRGPWAAANEPSYSVRKKFMQASMVNPPVVPFKNIPDGAQGTVADFL